MKSLFLTGLFVAGILFSEQVASQNCNCAPQECCSQFGYCGTTNDYCGQGCQSGPCSQPASYNISDTVTESFFNGIIAKTQGNCPGRGFYTRNIFLRATADADYQEFARSGSLDDSKREIAAFFAHVTQVTDHLCYIEAVNDGSQDFCDRSYTEYPCAANKSYYGRGPLQITYNYNYGEAGKSIGFDGLKNPEIVATDQLISFKTALWFWMEFVHSEFVSGNGFGATTRALNEAECDGGTQDAVTYYTDYCKQFGVPTGGNLRCSGGTDPPSDQDQLQPVVTDFGIIRSFRISTKF